MDNSIRMEREFTLNLLEFLASAISIYMNILQMVQGSHILVLTDSSIIDAESHDAISCRLVWTLVGN